MVISSRKDSATGIKVAGSTEGLVERVIAALEHGLSLYKRHGDFVDEEYFELLKPDLDVLIKITEDLAGLMNTRRALCEGQLQEAQRAIGECGAKMVAKNREVNDLTAKLAEGEAKAFVDRGKVADLQREIDENNRKIDEVNKHKTDLAKFFWVPGYNWYLVGTAVDDLVKDRGPILAGRLSDAVREKESTEKELRALHVNHDSLAGEKRDLERTIRDLEDSRKVFEQNCKVYSDRFALLSDIIQYYRQLSNKIGDIKDNLDLPMIIERLYESRQLVQLNGEVHEVTLKVVLMNLGEDYDHYLENGGIEEAVSVSFKLLNLREPLPSGYRLATVREVSDHRDALFKAMPKWEIANLIDGSVMGQCYGGSVSGQIRNDVGHKLAIKSGDYDHNLENRGIEEAVNVSFKLLNLQEPLPSGYRLATVREVSDHRDALFKAMPQWEIANLIDGSVTGQSYGGSVSGQIRNDVGHKLAIKSGDYNHNLENRGIEEAVNVSFKLLHLQEPLPSGYRLATIREVSDHRDALFKAMPQWEIANLIDGSVTGQSYGGSVSGQIRNDVGHKLAVKSGEAAN